MSRKKGSKKAVTLQDIAARAGVSISTVSRVLNQPESVDEQKRIPVQAAIKEMGYVRVSTHSVRKGKSNSKGLVALMVPDVANPHFQEFISLVERRLSEMDYMMLLCIFDNQPEIIDKYFREILQRKVDGCIMACLRPAQDSPWVQKLITSIPVVAVQSDIEGIDKIETTDEQGTYEMVDYLISMGHRRIGFIG